MPKFNVLFMQSQTYFGADSYIHSLLMRNLNREKFTVHVALNYGNGNGKSAAAQAIEEIPDIHIRPTRFGTSVNFRSKREIIKNTVTQSIPMIFSLAGLAIYIRSKNIQLIHCTEKPRDAFYGQILAKLTGAKCVIELHVKAEDWISKNVQWAMRQADGLIGVSEFVAQSIVEMGYPTEKTYFVLNAIEADRWDPTFDGRGIREEFHIHDDTALLLTVSRLCYWKGHTELFKALAKVKHHTPNFKLLVVGEDDPRAHPGHGSYTAELKMLAEELGINDQIIFTGFRSDVAQLMAASDIYTMPSFEEPFGMVFLEAMCMQKPVVALNNGGAREVVEHNKSGLLSEPQDIKQLAKNIIQLIEAPEMREWMGKYGRERAETYFTPQRMALDTEQIYYQILNLADRAAIS
ncbi:MAG: glycosyltransferase family 4 protein [Anaerolineales bacterium]|jgi:glycosyltransferase involved in cell wall biosynthesis